ncbi:lysylphosphatidylglycerol synthase domain-containing protein [Candidatus Mycoplasma haematominutum]|uniref:Uncharacterized protein n=1 Tax=Candidatus Mycoplasma haematominutum 'Birmingham 1' TaxID=1116213 RepID=G8C3M9_9MOLU|nr:lysylphosphatidylglycerol synthase domain-containing protein [Candidatus Mycoplasma haematominutum]CCE66927.1 conserved hypothetical protein (putativemembrane protein) [Candidatus Mycoplasma haematominutum 'Birmingham 1']
MYYSNLSLVRGENYIREPVQIYKTGSRDKKHWIVQTGRRFYNFNKKYFINIWAILFLLTIFLNFYLFQPIKWSSFKAIFQKDYVTSTTFISVLIFGLSFFLINDLILAKLTFAGRIRTNTNKKISVIEWIKLHSITFFIRSITPFSIGSEPYVIWWLKKQGVPLRQGSAIVSALTISWFIAQGVITWPSFISLHIQNSWTSTASELKYYWMIVVGLIVDAISSLFVFTISYCKRIHYLIALVKYKFSKFFNLTVLLTIEELKRKYLENKSFKREFKRIFFDLTTLRTVTVFTIQNVLNYSLFALLANAIKGDNHFLTHFDIINISTTSNNFVPTPGSEGSIQFTIEKMHSLTNNPLTSSSQTQTEGSSSENGTQEIIFLWRWFQKYQPLLLSSIFLSGYSFYKVLKESVKKIYLKTTVSPISNALYSVNNFLAVPV